MPTLSHVQFTKGSRLRQQSFDLCLILTTVALFYLAFPTGGYPSLTWLVLLPVLTALHNQNAYQAFMMGFLAALLGWLFSIWWVVPGLTAITYSHENLMIPLVLLYCCLCAIPYALACGLHIYLHWNRSIHGALLSALTLTALVNYSPQILPGNLAHALYSEPKLIQSADIGGVPLVFLVIHSIGFLLAYAVTMNKENSLKRIYAVGLALIIFTANYSYGHYRLNQEHTTSKAATKTLKVAMIQPNISVEHRTRQHWQLIAPDLMSMIATLTQSERLDLVILPELPTPVSYQYYDFDRMIINQSLNNTPLLYTAIEPMGETLEDTNGYFNTIELIVDKRVQQKYSKQVLLPFGEYLPLEETFPWMRSLFPYVPNYKAGKTDTLLTLKGNENSILALGLICYEAVFPDIVATNISAGGELLINTSNDAWFGKSAGQKVHLALSTFRSVEFRKTMIRTTNNGISVIIDPYGRQITSSKIAPHTRGYSVSTIKLFPRQSFFQQYPNLIKWLILVITAFAIVITLLIKKKGH